MRQSAEQAADETEDQRTEQRRRSGGDRRTEEHGIHRDDLRGVRREQIVHVEVDEREDGERHQPRQAVDAGRHLVADPVDHLELAEFVGHRDEHTEEDQRLPRSGVGDDVLPRQHAGDEKNRDAREGRRRRVDVQLFAKTPQDEQQHERGSENPLVARHRATLLQFVAREGGGLRCLLERRRVDLRHHPRRRDEADETGNDRGEGPVAPGDLDLHLLRGLLGQRISRHRGEEHGGGDHVDLQRRQHQVGAEFAPRGIGLRRRVDEFGERSHDRVDHSARACGVRRRRGGKDEIGDPHPVRQPETRLAYCAHEDQRDTTPETRDDERFGDEERRDDEPDRRVREARERFFGRHRLGDHCQRESDDRHRTRRQRLQDQSQDRRDEDPEHVHAVGVDACRSRDEVDDDADDQRNATAPPRRAEMEVVRVFGVVGARRRAVRIAVVGRIGLLGRTGLVGRLRVI